MDWKKLEPTGEDDVAGQDWDSVAPEESETTSADALFADPQFDTSEEDSEAKYPFLGKRWREITDPAEARDAWVWLRDWVEWFVREYEVKSSEIPKCWYRHRPVVAELWAVANAEMKAWEEGAASTLPLTGFHNYVPGVLDRIKNTNSVRRCVSAKEHLADYDIGDGRDSADLRVDESDWAVHMASVSDLEGQLEAGRWRAVVSNEAGQQEVSQPVEVPASAGEPQLSVSTPVISFDGSGQPSLAVRISGAGLYRSWWEQQQTDGSWVMRMTSMRDISASSEQEDEQA